MDCITTTKNLIERIEKSLAILSQTVEQDKCKKLNWLDAGDLGFVASELENLVRFYGRNDGQST